MSRNLRDVNASRRPVRSTQSHGSMPRSVTATKSVHALFWCIAATPVGERGDRRRHAKRRNARRPVSRVLSRPRAPGDGHSSGTSVAGRLARPTRTAARKHACAGCPALPPLFGLAPGGVCRAAAVAGRAVRSYRTLSPLPRPAEARRRAVCSLWHFPWGRPRRALPGTVFPWSPDFPPPRLRARRAAIRPSGSRDQVGACRRRVKPQLAGRRPARRMPAVSGVEHAVAARGPEMALEGACSDRCGLGIELRRWPATS